MFKETYSKRFQNIFEVLIKLLVCAKKTCPEEDLELVATLFEHHTEGVPKYEIISQGIQVSYGFYVMYLKLTMTKADPVVFFQILKIDRQIGWTNPEHLESLVFVFKGLKIIEDEKVTKKVENFYILK